MIFYKKAPAGYIAQFFTDAPIPGRGLLSHQDRVFLHTTGQWCPTLEEAIESVKVQRPKELKKLQKKIEDLEDKLDALKEQKRLLAESSDTVVCEK